MKNQLLLEIARNTIQSNFDSSIKVDRTSLFKEHSFLKEKAATFVTLTLDKKLRGCVGSLEANYSLLDDLMTNARNAAFHDPRFYELSEEEFTKVDLEISLLCKAIKIEYSNIEELKKKIKINHHGVILKHQNKKATFLPQVWEQLPSFDSFFMHLWTKANFEEDYFSFLPEVYIYEVHKIK